MPPAPPRCIPQPIGSHDEVPDEAEVAQIPGGRNAYLSVDENGLRRLPSDGRSRHRTIPSALGQFDSSQGPGSANQSGQAGRDMVQTAMGTLKGIPIKYLADWTIASPPASFQQVPTGPSGMERNVVATVRDWSDRSPTWHDLSGPIAMTRRSMVWSALRLAELSTDEFPILDPQRNIARTFKVPCATPIRLDAR